MDNNSPLTNFQASSAITRILTEKVTGVVWNPIHRQIAFTYYYDDAIDHRGSIHSRHAWKSSLAAQVLDEQNIFIIKTDETNPTRIQTNHAKAAVRQKQAPYFSGLTTSSKNFGFARATTVISHLSTHPFKYASQKSTQKFLKKLWFNFFLFQTKNEKSVTNCSLMKYTLQYVVFIHCSSCRAKLAGACFPSSFA